MESLLFVKKSSDYINEGSRYKSKEACMLVYKSRINAVALSIML